jgi:putative redox protein
MPASAERSRPDEPVAHGGTGTAPPPLQTVVESVTFNRTAAELDFAYEGIEFRASYTIDIRGRMGNRAVRRHFQTVRLEASVFTSEGEDRLRRVVEETEARCPVFNLISDARVNLESLWIREGID